MNTYCENTYTFIICTYTNVIHFIIQKTRCISSSCVVSFMLQYVHTSSDVKQHTMNEWSIKWYALLYCYLLLLTIFIIVWKVDLITEQYHPLPQLYRSHHYTIRCATILTIMIKRL